MALGLASALQAETFKLTGAGNTVSSGVYVGPYEALRNYDKTTKTGDAVALVCVDWNNRISVGDVWNANVTYLGDGTSLANTRYGGPANGSPSDALTRYRQAAWLTLQFGLEPASAWGDIHRTIWNLFVDAAPNPSSSQWLTRAQSEYLSAGIDFSQSYLVTNVAPVRLTGQKQEFLVTVMGSGDTPVPEPTTYLLCGAGLVALAVARRRRAIAH